MSSIKTRSRSQNEAKPDISLNWIFFTLGMSHVQVMDVPYPLFIQRNSSRKLFADNLQQELGFQADVNTLELWEPKNPLPVKGLKQRKDQLLKNDLQDLAEEVQHALPLSTILGGKEKDASIVHIIITAEALISLNWCFSSSDFSITDIRVAAIPRDLFNKPSQKSRKLFSDLLQNEFNFCADPNTIQFLTPKDPLPVKGLKQRKDQLLKNGLQDLAEEAELALPLSTILGGKEKDATIVHIIVTLISLNWCFFSSEFSIIDIRVAAIPQDLFNKPSQQSRKLFSDLLQNEFNFRADPNTIQFLTPKVPFPITEIKERKDQLLKNGLPNFAEKAELALPLSTILGGKEKDSSIIHLFVCVKSPNESHEGHDKLADLPESERFKRTVAASYRIKAPSVGAQLIHYRDIQRSPETRIYDGHYPPGPSYSTIAPPLELYHPIFNRFLGLIDHCSPTVDDLKHTQGLMNYLGELSSVDENVRNERINGYLSGILGRIIQPSENADKTKPDGVSSVLVGMASVPLIIAEFKKSLGEGNCDPCIQASLIGGGAWLGILGAVWTDRVIVQSLIELRWFGISSTEESKRILRNAQILLALRQAVQELQQFYRQDLATIPVHESGPHPRLYPYPTSYTDNSGRVEFKYLRSLDGDMSCVTFLVQVISAEGQTKVRVGEEIVVKYVAKYGKEVHEFLASKFHAPELLHYGCLPDSPNFASGEGNSKEFGQRDRMSMVVMRYIDAEPSFQLSDHCREQLEEILLKLHLEGYVFGDLRNQNILVDNSGSVKLIDFNWCGEYDTRKESSLNGVPKNVQDKLKGRLKPRAGPYACYPLSISMSIDWADGVKPLRAILPGHDWSMLKKLK
ncbi:hypothetical protein Clacol_010463 [Clathrus columnatus]|uniref:Protein kinase domain-containing protein n=1 Tax=Clathrus columnatus TaxID=1419009 RepID=A0AAV5AU65_9AGAM|nr:hypothetical protein Clacol_010463 [Clathrus columnatus]